MSGGVTDAVASVAPATGRGPTDGPGSTDVRATTEGHASASRTTKPRVAPAPLFTDPLGAPTDPTLVRGPDGTWWLFATQRRPDDPGPGVTWVHGTDIAVATSDDGGLTWTHRGVVAGLDPHDGRNTLWAPEVVHAEGRFHMFVSYIRGVPDRWEGHDRHVLHHVSDDLVTWEHRGVVPLSSDRVIDACVAPLPGGGYRMWFKDEAADSTTWCADSPDLESWGPSRAVITGRPHEGPNVFALGGWHWMLVDEWRGQAVHRSSDLETWTYDGHVLDRPGRRPADGSVGHHADVVVGSDAAGEPVAWVFYFTHLVSPFSDEGRTLEAAHDATRSDGDPVGGAADGETPATRRAVVQVAVARVVDGHLVCDRDEPVDLDLRRVPLL
ncbi:hypothetical protein ACFO3K_18075 [Cellulomonas algicola]|uniref:hypothetical protein n=1 Tax=Cellulomonas algicola TaxID=2071633 RepID=UPI001C3FCAE4|nr:hypothetical protein [Cellulomonas algicola]